jgi:AcrR family transcriptional regulator
MDEPPLGFRPRQARGVAARTRVYDAAIRQFAEQGVAATRIEDVVAAGGVAWGTFYRYFPRKEDVLLEAGSESDRRRLARFPCLLGLRPTRTWMAVVA